ncbi:MAG: hypothetical protein GXP47_13505 [Acidobacteria bacterium]|nr:hypothetical protein [Acidobacteriota bacterium]
MTTRGTRLAVMTGLVLTASLGSSLALVRAYTSLGDIPKTMGPRDQVFFSCKTNTTRRCLSNVAVSLEELDGPAGRHLVEINVESHRLRGFRLPLPYYQRIAGNAESSSIMIISAMTPFRVGSRYRLTVQSPPSRPSLLLPITAWTVVDHGRVWNEHPEARPSLRKQRPATGVELCNRAYADILVVPPRHDQPITRLPAITGHTIGSRTDYKPEYHAYTVKLCVASIPTAESSPERFLYVVELLSSDQSWQWLDAWRPRAPPGRDPRCAYIVKTDILGKRFYSRPGTLTFRPLLIRADGTRWRGPAREVPVPPASSPRTDRPS